MLENRGKADNIEGEMAQKLARKRGDGIADFILLKSQYAKTREEVHHIDARLKNMEDLFHKQSIIHSSNEIVTTASLQNYLDALSSHVEKQFNERVKEHNE